MKAHHFALYSSVRQGLVEDFKHMQGKDLVPFVRAVEVLKRRFELQPQGTATQLNGTDLVMSLLRNTKLVETMEVFNSDEGRQLITLYRSSINSQEQNLACSQWRVQEIEAAAQKLKQSARLSAVFSNIHKSFVERSARKCLKTSCKAINENMNRLDSVLRRPSGSSRRQATISAGVRAKFNDNELVAATGGELEPEKNAAGDKSAADNQQREEEWNEFQEEELELCRFLKRTNSTSCQASGKELSSISFSRNDNSSKPVPSSSEGATPSSSGTSSKLNGMLSDFMADYEEQLKWRQSQAASRASASQMVLAQCETIRPLLDYHLYAVRWYTRQQAIRSDKFESRASWCPSLSYWLQIDRLCGQLGAALAREANDDQGTTFAY